ncbi:MAG: 4'-phosphopantetheinyl transferase superfamily protein [Oscillospiraceae bacterium]|nr:4'-phosphopantetheinyl transferase superfamily protein [Oscillospiraceae bacterium]
MVFKSMELGRLSGHTAGRQLLAELYHLQTGGHLPEIAITSRGKPYFLNSTCYFSISHTKSRAFCVLSDKPVGIDAEELDRPVNLGLAEKILSAKEKAQYDAAPDKRMALLTFWVLKEAEGKRTGEGICGYPNHTEFDLADPRVKIIENHLVAIIE